MSIKGIPISLITLMPQWRQYHIYDITQYECLRGDNGVMIVVEGPFTPTYI